MSPTSSRAGSTGATVTSWRLRISGTLEEPVGRNSTVAPAATRAATASMAPMGSACRGLAGDAIEYRPGRPAVEGGGPGDREGVDEHSLVVDRRDAGRGQIVEALAEPGQAGGDGPQVQP